MILLCWTRNTHKTTQNAAALSLCLFTNSLSSAGLSGCFPLLSVYSIKNLSPLPWWYSWCSLSQNVSEQLNGVEYPFGQFRTAALAMSQPLAQPQVLGLWAGWWHFGGTTMKVWENCSAVAKTQVCYQHFSSCKYTAQHCKGTVGKVDPLPVRPNAFHNIQLLIKCIS